MLPPRMRGRVYIFFLGWCESCKHEGNRHNEETAQTDSRVQQCTTADQCCSIKKMLQREKKKMKSFLVTFFMLQLFTFSAATPSPPPPLAGFCAVRMNSAFCINLEDRIYDSDDTTFLECAAWCSANPNCHGFAINKGYSDSAPDPEVGRSCTACASDPDGHTGIAWYYEKHAEPTLLESPTSTVNVVFNDPGRPAAYSCTYELPPLDLAD